MKKTYKYLLAALLGIAALAGCGKKPVEQGAEVKLSGDGIYPVSVRIL